MGIKLSKYPTLKKAPITEAIIDIRVKLPSSVTAEKIHSIYELVKEQYPEEQKQEVSEFKFEPKADVKVKASEAAIKAYRYITSDKKQILQTRLDGFALSRLHPYEDWDTLRDEAFRLWKMYVDIATPELIYRVAVRYINNLNIPMPKKDFNEYLTAAPTVPEALPQAISSFFNRIVLPNPSINSHAIITQALEQVIDTNQPIPIILDIDAIHHKPDGLSEDEAWTTIENLRHFKNDIFFNSITPELKELYK